MPGSSLGYPFTPRGSPASNSLVSGLLSTALAATSHTLTLPWHLFLRWLSWWSSLLLNAVTMLGAPPLGFIPAEKLRELNSIVDHMHAREDLYRRAIRELQDEMDAKDSDRKRALYKLKATKAEIAELTNKMAHLQQEYESSAVQGVAAGSGSVGAGPLSSGPGGRLLVHGTFGVVATAVWYFSQSEHPSLQWKLVFIMFFPLLWSYVSWVTSEQRAATQRIPLVLLCTCWFLVGLIMAQSLSGSQYNGE